MQRPAHASLCPGNAPPRQRCAAPVNTPLLCLDASSVRSKSLFLEAASTYAATCNVATPNAFVGRQTVPPNLGPTCPTVQQQGFCPPSCAAGAAVRLVACHAVTQAVTPARRAVPASAAAAALAVALRWSCHPSHHGCTPHSTPPQRPAQRKPARTAAGARAPPPCRSRQTGCPAGWCTPQPLHLRADRGSRGLFVRDCRELQYPRCCCAAGLGAPRSVPSAGCSLPRPLHASSTLAASSTAAHGHEWWPFRSTWHHMHGALMSAVRECPHRPCPRRTSGHGRAVAGRHAESDGGALRAADPVALHLLDAVSPVQALQIRQQPALNAIGQQTRAWRRSRQQKVEADKGRAPRAAPLRCWEPSPGPPDWEAAGRHTAKQH